MSGQIRSRQRRRQSERLFQRTLRHIESVLSPPATTRALQCFILASYQTKQSRVVALNKVITLSLRRVMGDSAHYITEITE